MALVLVALFVALPFAELAVIVAAADAIGLGWTFLALIAMSVAGAWLVRREGSAIWRRANDELRAGRMPARELLDGALALLGGALLLTPGFITDALGLVLLFPPTRALLRPLVVAFMARRARSVVVVTSQVGDDTATGDPRRRAPSAQVHEARSREA